MAHKKGVGSSKNGYSVVQLAKLVTSLFVKEEQFTTRVKT